MPTTAFDTATNPQMAEDAAHGEHESVAAGHPGAGEALPNEQLMPIGEVAREFGITLRALRFYETRRLVSPLRSGATRLYRRADRDRISLILAGRRLGFTLAEICHLLGGVEDRSLHLTRQQCIEQINLLERQKRGLETAIAELQRIYSSLYRMRLEDLDVDDLSSC